MIFLLKDGRYKAMNLLPTDAKFIRKYRKYQSHIAAIMVECFSLLHSDVYTIISPDHFQLEIEPMILTYSICSSTLDEPVNETNTLTRSLQIKTCFDLYNAASLIYQLVKNDDAMSVIGGYDLKTVSVLSLTIQTKDDRYDWSIERNSSTVIEFINDHGFICDTDDFLDAAVPKSARVEKGCYYVRYDRYATLTTPQYRYFDRKARLYMTDSHWCLDVTGPEYFQTSACDNDEYFNDPSELYRAGVVKESIKDSDTSYVGFCINGTGLLYLCVMPEAIALTRMDSFEISLDVRDEDYGEIEFDVHDMWGPTYTASTDLETLYIALYIPQMLEIDRYLFSKRIRVFSCEFIHERCMLRSAFHEFPAKMDTEKSVEFDLLAVIAKILLTMEPTHIDYDDMPYLENHS